MPQFSEEIVDKYIDSFFSSLPNNELYKERVVGGVYFALNDDSFREEIANGMEDVKLLIEKAEVYIEQQINFSSI